MIHILFLFLFGHLVLAQSGMSYLSVVSNSSGNPVVSITVHLKFAITDIVSGAFLYSETQNSMTDTYRWFNVIIGIGTVIGGNLSSIDWTSGLKN